VGAPVTQRSKNLNQYTRSYVVKKGDTLFSIAWQTRHDLKKLAKRNGIRPPYTIYPGQKLLFLTKKTIEKKSYSQSKERLVIAKKSYTKKHKKQKVEKNLKKVLKVRWQWPLRGSLERKFSSKEGRDGIDISARKSVIVKAAADGKVVYSGSGLIGYGNLLIIKHNEEFLSAYGFNRRLLAKEGAFVKAGDKVAEAGLVNGRRKLHFEIRRKGKPVNPLRYLPR
jgi:lipoprotein NlpD